MAHDVDRPMLPPESVEAGAPESKIEITPEMIAAGAEVLWVDSIFEIPEGWAERMTEEILRRALSVRCDRSDLVSAPKNRPR